MFDESNKDGAAGGRGWCRERERERESERGKQVVAVIVTAEMSSGVLACTWESLQVRLQRGNGTGASRKGSVTVIRFLLGYTRIKNVSRHTQATRYSRIAFLCLGFDSSALFISRRESSNPYSWLYPYSWSSQRGEP
jgi:hypothetical protein